MYDFKLFVAPGSCARVPTVALEEIGVPFETELVRLSAGANKTPEYLAVNPKGKVPALVIDGHVLTENVAILTWLNTTYPDANLLPKTESDLESARQIADISFFSGTVHPFVTRISMPGKFINGENAAKIIRPPAIAGIKPLMTMINDRLSDRPWWYGDQWSILDAYLYWVWWRIGVVDYPGQEFKNILDHEERVVKRPSVASAMEREAKNAAIMKAEGLSVPHR